MNIYQILIRYFDESLRLFSSLVPLSIHLEFAMFVVGQQFESQIQSCVMSVAKTIYLPCNHLLYFGVVVNQPYIEENVVSRRQYPIPRFGELRKALGGYF